ncbi:TPA: hypothetical protein ACH3X1_014341 [Trebouxia sp. C0004]
MLHGRSSQAEAQTSVAPMQQQAVACPAHVPRVQKAEAERLEEYGVESILADLSQSATQHKLNLPSRQAVAGMRLSELDPFQKLEHLSLPVSWRHLQAEQEQQARDACELAKRLQDEYDIEATAHQGLVNRTDASTNEHESCTHATAQAVEGNSNRKVQGRNAEEEDDGCCLCWCSPKEAGILHGARYRTCTKCFLCSLVFIVMCVRKFC